MAREASKTGYYHVMMKEEIIGDKPFIKINYQRLLEIL